MTKKNISRQPQQLPLQDTPLPPWERAKHAFAQKKQLEEDPQSLCALAAQEAAQLKTLMRQSLDRPDTTPETETISPKEPCYSGYPTDMTRCSPFFPVNSNTCMKPIYFENEIIKAGNWGSINFTGPRLTVYDEDVLVAILGLLYDKSNKPLFSLVKDKFSSIETLTYTGPAINILKRMGIKQAGGADYKRLFVTLKRFTVSALEIRVSTGTIDGKRVFNHTSMANILLRNKIDELTKAITITINPFFYKTFLDGSVTMLNTETRMRLRSPIAKVLYRFVLSQRNPVVYHGSFRPLTEALNMDPHQPDFKLRQTLRRAINLLTEKNILASDSGFLAPDTVYLRKAKGLEKLEGKRRLRIDFSALTPLAQDD